MQPTGRTPPPAQAGQLTRTQEQSTGQATALFPTSNGATTPSGDSSVSNTERQRQILDEHSARQKGQMQDAVRQALSGAGLDPDNMFRPGRAVTFTPEQIQRLTEVMNSLTQNGSRVEVLPDGA
jgi:hypothetical protein